MRESSIAPYAQERLPRYTSYPTAPHFTEEIGGLQHVQWLDAIPDGERISLYIHIPFCRSMCWYCGCNTNITEKEKPVTDYLDVLKREITMVGRRLKPNTTVSEIHFGGGTPTIMSPEEMLDLMSHFRHAFRFAANVRIAIEIDPRRLTAEMASALGEAGVTRASLGVQTFDTKVQTAINRVQPFEVTAQAVHDLYRAGIDNLNFDLIYGLPHQTTASCVETANLAALLRPARLAVFGYAHVPTFKKHQRLIPEQALPDSFQRHEQARAISSGLEQMGYVQIGLDHFALPTDELAAAAATGTLRRNFQGYTTDSCATLVGLGASSISRFRGGYTQNDTAPGGYARRVLSGEFASVKGYRFANGDQLRACIIERLMCDFEVDIREFCSRFGADPRLLLEGNPRLAQLEKDGVVSVESGRVRLSGDRYLVRAAASAFDAYLEATARPMSLST